MTFALETGLPVAVLAILAWVLPRWFARRFTDTLRGVGMALLTSSGVLILVSAALFLGLYLAGGLDPTVIAESPLAAARYFLWLGVRPAIIWVPLLMLAGLTLGQEVEDRRGRAMAARDTED